MTIEEFQKNEHILKKYDYVEIQEENKTLGIFVSEKYAEEVKKVVQSKSRDSWKDEELDNFGKTTTGLGTFEC